MIRLLDSLAVITPGQLARVMVDEPIDALAWYLYSPSQHRTKWTPDNLLPVARLVGNVLPIYVGQQKGIADCPSELTASQGRLDGQDCRAVLATYRIPDGVGAPVVLDVEFSTWNQGGAGALAYITAFVVHMLEWGFKPVIYSSRAGVNGCAAQMPAEVTFWVADWRAQSYREPDPLDLVAVAAQADVRPDQLLWQYASQPWHPILAEGVDWSVGNVPLWSVAADPSDAPVSVVGG